ncbi:hypothetical protein [Krasilnikovia sp. MM14-A1004]|uniref:hypothetical protein n=1 Tax=Krasilnikovia sp. MM14-A1004 TaxID=3373541 RepID=UPI00399C9E34
MHSRDALAAGEDSRRLLAAAKQFTPEELANLLMAIATINVWNRLAISTRTEPPQTP